MKFFKIFKLLSFLLLAFTLGYTRGWWKSYENISAPQPLIIVTLEKYNKNPLLQEILWEKLKKVLPYTVVIDKLPNLEILKNRLLAKPIKAHLVFLEREELLQLSSFFNTFEDFSPHLLDQLSGDFILEPKAKYFPLIWQNESANTIKIWGFVLPNISSRASKKSLMFLDALIQNPIFRGSDDASKTLRTHLFFK